MQAVKVISCFHANVQWSAPDVLPRVMSMTLLASEEAPTSQGPRCCPTLVGELELHWGRWASGYGTPGPNDSSNTRVPLFWHKQR